jgi:hypothetical protein
VESDGPTTEAGGGDARSQGNVVPFPTPRDWLGPREELVPIGKRVRPEPDKRGEDERPVELTLSPPSRADAFWGEESAEIHAVMPGPDVPRAPSAPAMTTGSWLRSGALRVAAGVLVAAACLVAAVARLGGSPNVDADHRNAPVGGGPAAGVIAGGSASAGISLALIRSNAQHERVPAKHGGAAASRRHQRIARDRRVTPKHIARPAAARLSGATAPSAPAVAIVPVVETQAAAPQTSSSPSSTPPATSVAQAPTTTSRSTSPNSTRSHTASVKPGPVGPGAPFGPGHLQ